MRCRERSERSSEIEQVLRGDASSLDLLPELDADAGGDCEPLDGPVPVAPVRFEEPADVAVEAFEVREELGV